ncbi:hypothetical protein [Aeromicrobium sp.]|uniref:hypothetical protein n=1 Tax=Aeromicrobium sp. TaxID=1871063 RepID=UPI0019BC90E8|nr:hypothetical protein [Aeromicrobium sp.]MBC7630003.1 hypothetical protein [Aeromicrobium sp.]
MSGTCFIVTGARLLRITSMTFAIVLLIGFVAVQSFANQYGRPSGALVMDSGSTDTALLSAITLQESTGLTCSVTPVLTDTVLFQAVDGTAVQVLRFDEAIAASTAREGWIRRYCA